MTGNAGNEGHDRLSEKHHRYRAAVRWTGNEGSGTSGYTAYRRAFDIVGNGKRPIAGSSDPAFRGDATCWNPEELLVASLSACHQLWYLHLCAAEKIVVVAYQDEAEGVMAEEADGAGQFIEIVLRPRVTITDGGHAERAQALHADASRMCFIERTLKCGVRHEATVVVSNNGVRRP